MAAFIDGPCAIASGSVCARLEHVVLDAARRARQRGERIYPDVGEFIEAMSRAAAVWRTSPALSSARSGNGMAERSADPTPATMSAVIGTEEVAKLLGTTTRAVRARAARATLPATKAGGAWAFLAADIAAHIEREVA